MYRTWTSGCDWTQTWMYGTRVTWHQKLVLNYKLILQLHVHCSSFLNMKAHQTTVVFIQNCYHDILSIQDIVFCMFGARKAFKSV